MILHVIEGEAGCRFAVENRCAAVVVDALRASATAALLLDAGVPEVLAVREVEDAFAAKSAWPDALIAGERGGMPPPGFNLGNSPREVRCASGRRVIFTTTTGAGRLISAREAPALFMGSTVNARACAAAAGNTGYDTVLIPAGLTGDPDFDAVEDRAAAVYIAMIAGGCNGEGRDLYEEYRGRIESQGLPRIFAAAPHAEKLRAIGMEEDIAFCARENITDAVPRAMENPPRGIILRNRP
jgi:2-phosphosulfolactate phosphatase